MHADEIFHRPHAVAKSRQPDHRYVDQQKGEQSDGQKEMNRARGLLSAEHGDGSRNPGDECRRHGQARPDHQRKQHEDHEQVRHPLHRIVGPGILRAGSANT